MSKHTPGPWEINRYTNFTGYSIYAGDRGCIAERWYPHEQSELPHGKELEANARLIAAAPCMLELLKEFEKEVSARAYSPELEHMGPLVIATRTLIAKATGES